MKFFSHTVFVIILCVVLFLAVTAIVLFDGRNAKATETVAANGNANRKTAVRKTTVDNIRHTTVTNRFAAKGTMPIEAEVSSADEESVLAPRPVFDKERIVDFAAAYRTADTEGSMSLEKVADLCKRFFGGTAFSLQDVGDILCTMIRDDDPNVRIATLTALSAFRRCFDEEDCMNEIADIANGEDDGNGRVSAEVPDEIEQRFVFTLMSAGLSDENSNVRDAAYSTLVSLPAEERNMLSIQLLGHEDDVLKEVLLKATMKSEDDSSLTLNFHALDDESKEIRSIANENIFLKTGRRFQSSSEAFEWLESERHIH